MYDNLKKLLQGDLLEKEKMMSSPQDPIMSVGEPASFDAPAPYDDQVQPDIPLDNSELASKQDELNKEAKSPNIKTKEEKEKDKKKNPYAKFLGDFSKNAQGLNPMKGFKMAQYRNNFRPSDEMGSLRSQVLQSISNKNNPFRR